MMKTLINNDDFVDGFLTATTVITILLLLLFSIPVSAQLPESGSLSIKTAAGAGRSIAQEVDGNTTGDKSLTTLSTTAGFSAPHSILEFRGYPSGSAPGPAPNCSAALLGSNIAVIWDAPVSGGTPTSTEVQVTDNTSGFSTYCCNVSVPYPTRTVSASTMTTLVNGRTYQFRLFYQNASGQSSSCFTNQVLYSLPDPPGNPRNFNASVESLGIQLTWLAPNTGGSPSGYLIERSTNGTTYSFLANRGGGTTQYFDANVIVNQDYWYRIRAENSGGESAWVNIGPIKFVPL